MFPKPVMTPMTIPPLMSSSLMAYGAVDDRED